jgi:hemerythrin-like metal-binding protein
MSAATSQSLAVGVPAMDDQHEILMDTLNQLREQLGHGSSCVELNDQISRLVEFAEMHFSCEESLLRRHGFPSLQGHCDAHQTLLNLLRRTGERAERGDDAELHRALGYLRGQYMQHVRGLDREYAEWMNAQGVF